MEQNQNEPVQNEQQPEKSKKGLVIFLILLLVAILTAAGLLMRARILEKRAEELRLARAADPFIEEDGIYDLSKADLGTGERLFELELPVKSIDLGDQKISLETYDKLAAKYPDAKITWMVPVGSARVDCEADSVLLTDAEEATLKALPYLKNLKLVDGTGVADPAPLIALAEAHPEWEVRYSVPLFGKRFRSTDEWLTLNDVTDFDPATLIEALTVLPKVTDIDLVGVEMTNEQKAVLRAAWPEIRWYWHVDVGGNRFKSTDEKIDFTRTDFDSFDELLTVVGCFNRPAYVDVSTQGFPNEMMERAMACYPETKFVWVLRVGKNFIRTDVTVLDLSYSAGERSLKDGTIDFLRYLTSLEALSLNNQSLSDLTPLSGLTKLKILCLASNHISDLTPLAGLTNLEYLNLANNKITDITPLAGLTKLTDLNLMSNDVTSLGVLSECTELKRCCASKNSGLQAGEQTRIEKVLPGCKFDFNSSGIKVAWQNDDVYDVVSEIFVSRQMSPLR